MSRNNVLHLWPFVIQDLKALGAKKFFGKFCAGSIDHISIRQLQSTRLFWLVSEEASPSRAAAGCHRVPEISGVAFIFNQKFFKELFLVTGIDLENIVYYKDDTHYFVMTAKKHSLLDKGVLLSVSIPWMKPSLLGKGVLLSVSIPWMKPSLLDKGVLLSVSIPRMKPSLLDKGVLLSVSIPRMKPSLLDKGVLLNDYSEVSRLLNVDNVDRSALMRYAQEAARFSTDGRLPLRDFALNHYGEPDVALFDFTSIRIAPTGNMLEMQSLNGPLCLIYSVDSKNTFDLMVYERRGRRLLCQLVGDSLLEPFWPTGSGCARGFLSALDAAWAVRTWGQSPPPHPLEVVAERESVYRLLGRTLSIDLENLHRDFGAYTLDPGTRYPNLNRSVVTPHRVTSFYDSDEPLPLDATASAKKRRRGWYFAASVRSMA
ncbi:Protein MICAL-3 [Operophtera brumata]|uniref:Protein MICAL-3 n=1 Tax=Operophtera brumata TaxID=104452 RepID=A0A0L7LTT0_OPEBR|nr:Protein MICAL-3 [Operophtera brumata]